MASYKIEDAQGNQYRIERGAGPRFFHPENIGGGSDMLAAQLLASVPFESLCGASNFFWFDVLSQIPGCPSHPAEALAFAIASSYLTITRIGSTQAINDEEPDPRPMLRVKIQQALTDIIAGERAEAAMYQRQMDKESTLSKGLIYTGAFMEGIGTSAWGMVIWAKEVSDVFNPVLRVYNNIKAVQDAWESDNFAAAYTDNILKAEKRELAEALGFDPTTISLQKLDEAIAMTSLLLDDPSLGGMLYKFVKDYAEVQHSIEITSVAGSGAFEIILTVILAAVTGGAGVMAVVASKAALLRKFGKTGDLLKSFAEATKSVRALRKERNAKGKPAEFKDLETTEATVNKGSSGPEIDENTSSKSKVSNVSYEDFIESVDDFEERPELVPEAYRLFKEKDWTELESYFEKHNLNGGWPPNRGAISTTEVTLSKDTMIDRYGGYIDKESGEFVDKGTFTANAGEPFPNRALPESTKEKPYKMYKVIKDIPKVQKGEVIPWFGQPGGGAQYELPLSINDLLSKGYLKGV